MTNAQQFLWDLCLSEIADTLHKHPKSGSDYTLTTLLEKYSKRIEAEVAANVIQAISDPENQPNQFGITL